MLRDFIYQNLIESIIGIENNISQDIYALSCYISNINDDPRLCSLVFGFNTYENYKKEVENAYDENEAKWNYAFWLQNSIFSIGDTYTENSNVELVEAWIKSIDLYYSDADEKEDFDACMEKGDMIIKEFVSVVLQVVSDIHLSGIIEQKFGKEIPIIVHELEYYNQIADQNEKVNPIKSIEEFVNWVRGL